MLLINHLDSLPGSGSESGGGVVVSAARPGSNRYSLQALPERGLPCGAEPRVKTLPGRSLVTRQQAQIGGADFLRPDVVCVACERWWTRFA